jgi:hypothetical protein
MNEPVSPDEHGGRVPTASWPAPGTTTLRITVPCRAEPLPRPTFGWLLRAGPA